LAQRSKAWPAVPDYITARVEIVGSFDYCRRSPR